MQSPLRPRLGLCLLALLGAAAAARAQGFTLAQVLSAPFPSELTTARRGDHVAWVFDAEGRRNVWVASAPAFRARQLTHFDADDGQEITSLVFAPDATRLAFVRGGEKNQAGEVPNPTSDPAGARQEVWVADARTGQTLKLGEGDAPVFSPAGDAVAFSREDHLWVVPVAGGRERKLFEIRGAVGAPAWSPDGTRLAFVSNRGDHSFVAVYEPRANRVRLLQPSVDRDIAPRWSADGRRLAFIRLFNVADTYSIDRERVTPWAVWVVDAQTGDGKQVWQSGQTEAESYSGLREDDFFRWAAGDRIVFPSERDGWMHLYSVPAAGGDAVLLTPGAYEVESVAHTPDGASVIFAANNGDIDRRHLWRVPVAGGEPQQLTRGEGVEMYPRVLGGGRQVVFCHSTARAPFQPYVADVDGTNARPLAPQALPATFPAAALVAPEQVVFKAADGVQVHAQLFKPQNAPGKLPAVVFMHGGPVRQMLLGWHYLYYYHNAYAFNQYLASRGYVVLSVNYRSGIGYGRAFREAQHRGARGASEYQDIVAAGKYLRERADVDARRIGLWGGSYGGYLTALGLARDSDLFAAGVDLHGVHDWSAPVAGLRVPLDQPERQRVARESSPITAVNKWRSPVLLVHGDDDRNVAFAQTVLLVRRLREQRVEFEQLVFPDEVHDFLRHQDWLRAYAAAADFFDRKLKQ
ncbi:MAG TPA: prolyl oligopeptidase family serine peptidase [Pyrinomonadaceae bacterium]|jgi:dipeptidyl aminopeptidase/acylaminoacyl peptidase